MSAPIPQLYSLEAHKTLSDMMYKKYTKINDGVICNDILLMQMSKKINEEKKISSSASTLICDALLNILKGNESIGLSALKSLRFASTEYASAYIVTLWLMSQYDTLLSEIDELISKFDSSESILSQSYSVCEMLGYHDLCRSIIPKLEKINANVDRYKESMEKIAIIEFCVVSEIELTKFKEIYSLALKYIQKNRAYITSVFYPSQEDFSLIFNIIAKPQVMAQMNLELSFELSRMGLLESDLVIGFDYDDLDGAIN